MDSFLCEFCGGGDFRPIYENSLFWIAESGNDYIVVLNDHVKSVDPAIFDEMVGVCIKEFDMDIFEIDRQKNKSGHFHFYLRKKEVENMVRNDDSFVITEEVSVEEEQEKQGG